MVDTTILITVVEKESKGVSYNKLKSKTNVFQIESIDPKKIDNLEDFVKEELERDGYKIANLALDELISRVNHDYNRIIIELEKLKIYKHEEKSISLDDVFLMVRLWSWVSVKDITEIKCPFHDIMSGVHAINMT